MLKCPPKKKDQQLLYDARPVVISLSHRARKHGTGRALPGALLRVPRVGVIGEGGGRMRS